MNREIKYRAWDKENKTMFINDSVSINIDGSIAFLDTDGEWKDGKSRIELMQYAYKEDINGKEIYEGDIVKISETDEIDVVNWSDENEFCIGFGLFNCLSYEVIGNIYENPNLLEG